MTYINSPPQISIPITGCDKTFLVHRIFCVGRNYQKHIVEMGYEESDTPFVYFMKPSEYCDVCDACPMPKFLFLDLQTISSMK